MPTRSEQRDVYCAGAAHLRARNTGQAFWINCLGMLALSVVVLAQSLSL